MFFNDKRGFTLIELIVALAIFSILLTAVASSAVAIIRAQRESFAMQNIGEQVGYVLESMSKEIRMSKIVSNTGTYSSLRIVNSKNQTVDYRFDSGGIILRRVNNGSWEDLTDRTNAEFGGIFYIYKYSGSPGNRAKVTIVMNVEYESDSSGQKPRMDLQTTINSRSFYN